MGPEVAGIASGVAPRPMVEHGGVALQALVCCVFDKDEGPMILCADPYDAVGKQFKPLGRYLLPETFVNGRIVSIVLGDHLLLGAPVYIDDLQYDRNCFQFNICAVVSSQADTAPYRDLAQHLAMAFRSLEVDLNFLSKHENITQMRSILAMLRSQLNSCDECFVRVTGSHCISFRIRCRPMALTGVVRHSDVPLPLVDLQGLLKEDDVRADQRSIELPYGPDLTLLRLVPHINGVRTVDQVAEASHIDKPTVLLCLRHLLYFGLIAMIDEIQLESRYCLTNDFHCAFARQDVRAEVVNYVTMGRRESSNQLIELIIGLYSMMDGWTQSLQEYQLEHSGNLREHDISLRHFITFGLLHGFLERVHSYAQALSTEEVLELRTLRSESIPTRKAELKDQDPTITNAAINKDPIVEDMVARMKVLKDKEKGVRKQG